MEPQMSAPAPGENEAPPMSPTETVEVSTTSLIEDTPQTASVPQQSELPATEATSETAQVADENQNLASNQTETEDLPMGEVASATALTSSGNQEIMAAEAESQTPLAPVNVNPDLEYEVAEHQMAEVGDDLSSATSMDTTQTFASRLQDVPSNDLEVEFVAGAKSEDLPESESVTKGSALEDMPEISGSLKLNEPRAIENLHSEVEAHKDNESMLAEDVSRLKDKMQELESKVETLIQAQEKAQPRLITDEAVKVSESAPSSAEDWVATAIAQDEAASLNDVAELEKYDRESARWAQLTRQFVSDVKGTVPVFSDKLSLAGEYCGKLPSALSDKLSNRHKGLELTHKMLTMRADKVGDLISERAPEIKIAPLGRDEWEAALQSASDQNDAKRLIDRIVKERETLRYRAVSQARTEAENIRKKLLSFIERQLLPVLDGLDDGKKNSQQIFDQVNSHDGASPQIKSDVAAWFGSFDVMRAPLLEVLADVGVRPLQIELGTPIDYERHEPFETIADPTRQTEDVHGVVRQGYEVTVPDGNTLLLRAAQVAVVKN